MELAVEENLKMIHTIKSALSSVNPIHDEGRTFYFWSFPLFSVLDSWLQTGHMHIAHSFQ